MRLVAFLCLLLIGVVSTAQAVHVHGSTLPHREAEAARHQTGTLAPDESLCPLCVAMHSALPVALDYAAVPQALFAAESVPSHLVFVQEPRHFAGFSRPPPASRVA